jgi:cytochrome c
MKRKVFRSSLLLAFTVAVVFAAERGTIAEAKAMLQKAIAHYKSVGRQQALADFTARKPPFADRDLYVVCFSVNHRVVANGAFPRDVGTSGDTLKDLNGKGVAQVVWDAASFKGESVVRYRWINPVTHNVEMKIGFFAKVGEDVCGVGAYLPQ